MIEFEVSSGGADKRIYNDRNSTCSAVVYIELAYMFCTLQPAWLCFSY